MSIITILIGLPATYSGDIVARGPLTVKGELVVRTRLAPEVRRAQLLSAASSVFARDGFNDATLQDIADEAGVAKGLLHRYFDSKDQLIEALLAQRGDECAGGLEANIDAAIAEHQGDTAAVIRFALEGWMRKLAEDLAAGRWVADPEHRRTAAPYYDRLRATIIGILALTRPALPRDAADIVAAALIGATEAAVMLSAFSDGDIPERVAIDVAAEFCAAGLERVTADVS